MPAAKKRVLIVEDDAPIARALSDALSYENYDVRHAGSGKDALQLASAFHPDLILLDVSLPDANGFELYGALRSRGTAAVIFLTARGQKPDKLHGLNLGADDYVTKPFDLEELLARVQAVLRRARASVDTLQLGAVVIDLQSQQAVVHGEVVHLTRRECELLRYLAERRDRVVHRAELLREVWGYPEAPVTRSVDHAVARLRKKVEEEPHRPRFIHTVHGDGYCLTSTGRSEGPPA